MIDVKALRDRFDKGEDFSRKEIYSLLHEASRLGWEVKSYQEKERQTPEWQAEDRKIRAIRESEKPQVVTDGPYQQKWHICLNKYQRDNLLWLFAAMGYAKDAKGKSGVAPFTLAMNGDWAGEIPQMLQKPDTKNFCQLDPGDHANGGDLEDLERAVARWKSKD